MHPVLRNSSEIVHSSRVDQHASGSNNESNSDLTVKKLLKAKILNEQFIKRCLLHEKISNSSDGTDFGKFYSFQKLKVSQNWLTAFRMLEDWLIKNYLALNRNPAYLRTVQAFDELRYDYCAFFEFIDKLPADIHILYYSLLPLKDIERPSNLCDLDQIDSFIAIIRNIFTTSIQEFECFKNGVNNLAVGESAPRPKLFSPAHLTDFFTRQRQYIALEGHTNQAIRRENVEKLLTLFVSTFRLNPLSATLMYNAVFTEEGNIFDKVEGQQLNNADALAYAADTQASIAHPIDFKAEPKKLKKRAIIFLRRFKEEDILASAIPRPPTDDQIRAYREARRNQKLEASTAPASTVPATAAPSYTVPSYTPPAPAAIPAAPALSAPESATPVDSVIDTAQIIIAQDNSLLTDLRKRFIDSNASKALEKIATELEVQEKSIQSGYFRQAELIKLGRKMYRTAQVQQIIDKFSFQQDQQDLKAVQEYSKKLREYQKARAEGKYLQEPTEPILLDPSEVKLHIWCELSKTLQLPIATQLMQFNVAKIDFNEIFGISTEKLGESILQKEKKDYYADIEKFLADWQPWRDYLDREEKERYAASSRKPPAPEPAAPEPAAPEPAAPESAAPESAAPADSVMGTDQTKITQDSSLLTDLKKRFANPNAFEALEKIAIELDVQEKSVQSGFREPELLKLGRKMYRTAQVQQIIDKFLAYQDKQDLKAVQKYSKKLQEYQKARAEGKYLQEPTEPILLDASEVKLHIWCELSKTLQLPIATQLMQFNVEKIDINEIYGISTENLREVILEHERKDNYAELMKFLANWKPWRKHLDQVEKSNIERGLKILQDQPEKNQEVLESQREIMSDTAFSDEDVTKLYLKYTDIPSSRRYLGLDP